MSNNKTENNLEQFDFDEDDANFMFGIADPIVQREIKDNSIVLKNDNELIALQVETFEAVFNENMNRKSEERDALIKKLCFWGFLAFTDIMAEEEDLEECDCEACVKKRSMVN